MENENGHGKVMEHEKLSESHGFFFISHGILPILPQHFVKFVIFWSPLRNLKSLHFPVFSAKGC